MLQRSCYQWFHEQLQRHARVRYLSQSDSELLLRRLLPSSLMLTKYVLAVRGQQHDLVCEEVELDTLILKKTPGRLYLTPILLK